MQRFTDLCEYVSKNLTVSLDEVSYRRAKIAAAERGPSLRLTLVTRNTADFEEMGLQFVNPWQE